MNLSTCQLRGKSVMAVAALSGRPHQLHEGNGDVVVMRTNSTTTSGVAPRRGTITIYHTAPHRTAPHHRNRACSTTTCASKLRWEQQQQSRVTVRVLTSECSTPVSIDQIKTMTHNYDLFSDRHSPTLAPVLTVQVPSSIGR